jgi:molybdopterin-guanine dinucleotide biosynthesis protein MobB
MTEKPAVAFVSDRAGSGKTTLLVNVLELLKDRGYRVGTIKHALHEVQLDKKGSDSWRYVKAGADVCTVAGKGILATFRRSEQPSLDDAMDYTSWGTDIVLVEGFKDSPISKIEVYRSGHSNSLLCESHSGDTSKIVAVASDIPLELQIPVLPLNDPVKVCDFIVEHFLNNNTEI